MIGINCGTTFSKKEIGHFSNASAKMVWLVYAQHLETIAIASSMPIPLSINRRIISGITIDGWVSLIWITA